MGIRVGRYETLGAIASGGMAKVHLGRAVGMAGFERLVAIKLMHPHLAEDPAFVAMFLDEARLAALIRHPNVVATIDVQNSDDGLFLVMEYVEGCSLGALLRKLEADERAVPLDVAVRLTLDVLAGLQAAHEQQGTDCAPLGLIHRDISPANVLIGKDGAARITDFGVARAEERISSTRGGELKGKVPYMPPEQLRGLAVDQRVDVYAAGAVLWEVLVGRRLFRAPNEAALLSAILAGAEASPRELRPDVPEAIDQACMKALAPDRDVRFFTAVEFADALEDAAVDAGAGVATPRTVAKFVGALGV
ncbi:MAG: serine/threonine protein kinase, partial [Deltaproteobacteria bacterium]|nr:serine/threonine protein kinase [Deltaproteobacteria bacterium]MBW2533517.1 serine/threonine protein kinase [Deltaproteobacteria bacterium]